MDSSKDRNWRGKCRHPRWTTVAFAYNPPAPPMRQPLISDASWSQEERIELIHGFTVFTQSCEVCGYARSYREPGRAQA